MKTSLLLEQRHGYEKEHGQFQEEGLVEFGVNIALICLTESTSSGRVELS